MTQAICDNMAATSICQDTDKPRAVTISADACLSRTARPNANGLVSDRISVRALMLPRRVCSSRTRSDVMRRCCSAAAWTAARNVGALQGLVRNRKTWPWLTAAMADSMSVCPVSRSRTESGEHSLT